MPDARSKVPFAIGTLVSLVAAGTVGYRIIEGWTWFECFYMTVITLATIGYGEPAGITTMGRLFTVGLIVSGVGTVGYALTAVAQSIIQGELRSTLEKRRLQNAISHLSNHFIICGAGRVGRRVAAELVAEGQTSLILEREVAVSERLAAEGQLVLAGDATDEDTLRRAGIGRARGLVCALPSDAENVYTTLTARDMCPGIYIVARVNFDSATPKMLKAGANKIISPIATGAHQIAQALLRPAVSDFIEIATKTEGLDLVIEEVLIEDGSALCGKSLRESNVRSEYNVIVVSIKRSGGQMVFNPRGEATMDVGDYLIAIGRKVDLENLALLATARTRR